MLEKINKSATTALGLSVIVDIFDDDSLFEFLDNDRVLELSRQGGRDGFSSTKAILKSTGIKQRRMLQSGVTPVDFAVRVCEKLERVAEASLVDFDHVLLCHSHVDPAACKNLARQLCHRLNLTPNTITPFNHGCSGFLKLVSEASLLLTRCRRGARVAIISVETPEFWHDSADRLFCGIVSAGATAAVLEEGAGVPLNVTRSDDFKITADRRPNPDPLFRKDSCSGFDFHGNPCHRTVMRMNPEPVFLNGIELMLDNLRSALISIDAHAGQRIVVAPHQPSGKLLKALVAAAKTEFPELEFLNNLALYGNTISSSVPTLVSRLDEVLHQNKLQPLRDGDHLILLAAGICMNQISDYMSAGHACLKWKSGVLNAPKTIDWGRNAEPVNSVTAQ